MRRTLWGSAIVLIVLTGCAGGDGSRAGTTTSPADAPSESPFVNDRPCPAAVNPDLPAGSGCVSVATEGNETLVVYALTTEGEPTEWRMRLSAPDGDIDQVLEVGADYPRAVGASDVNGDGAPEWWVKLGDYASHGAPWARLNLFFPTETGMEPLSLDGEPLDINYGGISRLGEGAGCREGGLVLLRAEALDQQNSRWRVIERVYSIAGTEATFLRRSQKTIEVENYVDPAIRRNFRIECDGESFLPF